MCYDYSSDFTVTQKNVILSVDVKEFAEGLKLVFSYPRLTFQLFEASLNAYS